ncbi:MAG TPA: SH2 domain-containing protein, partial [Polyangia bacterium]
ARAELRAHGLALTAAQEARWQALHERSAGLFDVRWNPRRATPRLVRSDLPPLAGATPVAAAAALVAEVAPLAAAGAGSTFPLLEAIPVDGGTVLRHAHAVDGIPVLGDAITVAVRQDPEGPAATAAALTLARGLEGAAAQRARAVPPARAQAAAAADYLAHAPAAPVTSRAALAIWTDGVDGSLVYDVTVAARPGEGRRYLVDAIAGSVVSSTVTARRDLPPAPGPPLALSGYVFTPPDTEPVFVGGLLRDKVPLAHTLVCGPAGDCEPTDAAGHLPAWASAGARVAMCGPRDDDVAEDPGEPFCRQAIVPDGGWIQIPVACGFSPCDDPWPEAYRVLVAAETHFLWEYLYSRWNAVSVRQDAVHRRLLSTIPVDPFTQVPDWSNCIDGGDTITLKLPTGWGSLFKDATHEYGHFLAWEGSARAPACLAASEGFAEYVRKASTDFAQECRRIDSVDYHLTRDPGDLSLSIEAAPAWDPGGYYWSIGRFNPERPGHEHLWSPYFSRPIWTGTWLEVRAQVPDTNADRMALHAARSLTDGECDPAPAFAATLDLMLIFDLDAHAAVVRRAFAHHGYPAEDGGARHPDTREAPRVVAWAPNLADPLSSTASFTTFVGPEERADWFLLWAERGQVYDFATTSDGAPMFDTVLRLVDRAGRELGRNDNCRDAVGAAYLSQIDFRGAEPQACDPPLSPLASKLRWRADRDGWVSLEVRAAVDSPPARARVLVRRAPDPSGSGDLASAWPLHRWQAAFGPTPAAVGRTMPSGHRRDAYRFLWNPGVAAASADGAPEGRCDLGVELHVAADARVDVDLAFVPADPRRREVPLSPSFTVEAGEEHVETITSFASPYYRRDPGFYVVAITRPTVCHGGLTPWEPTSCKPASGPLGYRVWVNEARAPAAHGRLVQRCPVADESDLTPAAPGGAAYPNALTIPRLDGAWGDLMPAFHSVPATFYGVDRGGRTDEDLYRVHLNRGEMLTIALERWGFAATLDALGPAGMWTGEAPGTFLQGWHPGRGFDQSRTYLWTDDASDWPLTLVAQQTGDYLIRARPRHPGELGFYTISFRLHPGSFVHAPSFPRAP